MTASVPGPAPRCRARPRRCRSGVAGQAEDALGGDVALDLARPAGDREVPVEEEPAAPRLAFRFRDGTPPARQTAAHLLDVLVGGGARAFPPRRLGGARG